jgi:hypothetical protein
MPVSWRINDYVGNGYDYDGGDYGGDYDGGAKGEFLKCMSKAFKKQDALSWKEFLKKKKATCKGKTIATKKKRTLKKTNPFLTCMSTKYKAQDEYDWRPFLKNKKALCKGKKGKTSGGQLKEFYYKWAISNKQKHDLGAVSKLSKAQLVKLYNKFH